MRKICVPLLAFAIAALVLSACRHSTPQELQTARPPAITALVIEPTPASTGEAEPALTLLPTTVVAPPTASPVVTDTEMLILQQAAQELGCSPHNIMFGEPHVWLDGTTSSFSHGCTAAAGHGTSMRIKRFSGQADAQTAFDAKREGNPTHRFHDYPAYEWQYDERPDTPAFPMRHRGHCWQAERWLVVVEAFDDTHYAIAPDPLKVSKTIYQAARAYGLFAGE